MKGTCSVLETPLTWSKVAVVTGPKMPATPGWTTSHKALLALKLSSAGNLPTSADTKDLVRMLLSSLTAVTALLKEASRGAESSSKIPARK